MQESLSFFPRLRSEAGGQRCSEACQLFVVVPNVECHLVLDDNANQCHAMPHHSAALPVRVAFFKAAPAVPYTKMVRQRRAAHIVKSVRPIFSGD